MEVTGGRDLARSLRRAGMAVVLCWRLSSRFYVNLLYS